MKPPYIVRNLK